jgi:uncharacterized protein
MIIRDVVADDFKMILDLNEESVHFLSPLTFPRLQHLHQQAAYHRVIVVENNVQAFLLGFAETADYDSENFAWFCQRYSPFLYVDRIVVSANAQGKGYGQALYEDLFAFARMQTTSRITCEYNSLPLNTVSEKFHARNGFSEVGKSWSRDGKKCMSMQEKLLL